MAEELPAVIARPMGPLVRPAAPLSDDVIRLGEVTEADVQAIVTSADDPAAARWLPLPSPYTADDARDWIAHGLEAERQGASLEFAIRDVAGASYLGVLGVHFGRCRAGEAEIGYLVAPQARGRGVARRAIALAVPWVFATYGPRRIELLVQPDNVASRRTAEAAGAAFEGIRGAGLGFRGGRVADAAVYAFVAGRDYASPREP